MVDFAASTVLIRGAGGMASGIAVRLLRAGISKICLIEQPYPRAVQRSASFSDAVHDGFATVEGVTAALVSHPRELAMIWSGNCLGVLVSPVAFSLRELRPTVCIDATGARQGVFSLTDAPLIIGLRPVHQPGVHAHVVIETSGPKLGRVLRQGMGVPLSPTIHTGDVASSSSFGPHAPHAGMFRTEHHIGEYVKSGDVIGYLHINNQSASRTATFEAYDAREIRAPISGTLRGILRDYTPVNAHNRLARIDPREGISCHLISDRVLAVGGGVLEAILGSLHDRPSPHGGILSCSS